MVFDNRILVMDKLDKKVIKINLLSFLSRFVDDVNLYLPGHLGRTNDV